MLQYSHLSPLNNVAKRNDVWQGQGYSIGGPGATYGPVAHTDLPRCPTSNLAPLARVREKKLIPEHELVEVAKRST